MSDFSNNPAAKALQLLMAGAGYNFYNTTNLARADDLLVRQRASDSLSSAAQYISSLAPEFRRLYVPPSTRENPFPPADILGRLRDIERLAGVIRGIESQVRGMPVPTQDKIWWRYRNEHALLEQLIIHDYELVSRSSAIEDLARTLTADSWATASPAHVFDKPIADLQTAIRQRGQALLMPG